jgi:hypothetical protein
MALNKVKKYYDIPSYDYYHGYENGEEIINEGTFSTNSYVMGMHYYNPDHDITEDRFLHKL